MRIGSIYTLYGRRAGAELLTEQTLLGVSSRFRDITFVVYCNKEAFDSLPSSSRVEKHYVEALNNQYSKMLWIEFVSRRELIKDRIDMFWINSGCNAFPGPWNVPTLVSFMDFGEYHVPHKYDFKRLISRKLICIPRSLKRGTAFTSISNSTANDLFDLFNKKSTVIYPGASPRPLSTGSYDYKEVIRAETGHRCDDFILVPGRTDFIGKGLDVLLKAYSSILRSNLNVPSLVLIGPAGEQHELLLREISSLGLKDRVVWLGRVSDSCLNSLYKLSKFVVFPSRFEGFGFPLLEAMQFGKPIISSDAGSLPEIASDAALIFPSGDSSALATAMEQLISDPDLGSKLISLGLKRVNDFSWEQTYSKIYNLFLRMNNSNNHLDSRSQ